MTDNARRLYAGWKFKRSKLGRALALHTQDFFYSGQVLSWWKQESKDRIVQDFYSRVFAVAQAEDPAMACREQLAEYVLMFAQLAVVCLNEAEKAVQFYAANPYISGELHHRALEAAENVDELAQFKWTEKDLTDKDIVDYANSRSAVALYYANGLNMLRIELGDTDPAKDWFKPFVEAMLVVEEDRQREKLGMPALTERTVRSLPYSTFLNHVLDGQRQPFFTWTKAWPDLYLAGEGPLPA